MMDKRTIVDKWGRLSPKQQRTVIEMVALAEGGGALDDVFASLLEGRARMLIEDDRVFVGTDGRFVPSTFKVKADDPNPYFHFEQATPDFRELVERIESAFGKDIPISGDQVRARYITALAKVKGDRKIDDLLKGVHYPVLIPRADVYDDLGGVTVQFLAAAVRAYMREFPDRKFSLDDTLRLEGGIDIADGSRYSMLVRMMNDGPVVGAFFPTAFDGFPAESCLKTVPQLPEMCILSGAFDILSAIVAHTSVFGRDGATLCLDCSAMILDKKSCLTFWATDFEAGFGVPERRDVNASGGCLVLG